MADISTTFSFSVQHAKNWESSSAESIYWHVICWWYGSEYSYLPSKIGPVKKDRTRIKAWQMQLCKSWPWIMFSNLHWFEFQLLRTPSRENVLRGLRRWRTFNGVLLLLIKVTRIHVSTDQPLDTCAQFYTILIWEEWDVIFGGMDSANLSPREGEKPWKLN